MWGALIFITAEPAAHLGECSPQGCQDSPRKDNLPTHTAGGVAQWVKSPLGIPASGTAAKDGLSVWAPAPVWQTQSRSRLLAHPSHGNHLGTTFQKNFF